MPTRVKIISYLSRKDRDPHKQYPIGGTYLSIILGGKHLSLGFACTKYDLNGHGLQNSLVWWYISSQTYGRCYTYVEKWTMKKLPANDKWLTSWPNQSRTGIFLSPILLVAIGKDLSGKRPAPVPDVFSASTPKELWMYPLRMCTF